MAATFFPQTQIGRANLIVPQRSDDFNKVMTVAKYGMALYQQNQAQKQANFEAASKAADKTYKGQYGSMAQEYALSRANDVTDKIAQIHSNKDYKGFLGKLNAEGQLEVRKTLNQLNQDIVSYKQRADEASQAYAVASKKPTYFDVDGTDTKLQHYINTGEKLDESLFAYQYMDFEQALKNKVLEVQEKYGTINEDRFLNEDETAYTNYKYRPGVPESVMAIALSEFMNDPRVSYYSTRHLEKMQKDNPKQYALIMAAYGKQNEVSNEQIDPTILAGQAMGMNFHKSLLDDKGRYIIGKEIQERPERKNSGVFFFNFGKGVYGQGNETLRIGEYVHQGDHVLGNAIQVGKLTKTRSYSDNYTPQGEVVQLGANKKRKSVQEPAAGDYAVEAIDMDTGTMLIVDSYDTFYEVPIQGNEAMLQKTGINPSQIMPFIGKKERGWYSGEDSKQEKKEISDEELTKLAKQRVGEKPMLQRQSVYEKKIKEEKEKIKQEDDDFSEYKRN